MTDSKNGAALEPGVYVKGSVAKRADTPSEAAKFVWDGFVLYKEEPKAEEPKAEEPKRPSTSTRKNDGEAK